MKDSQRDQFSESEFNPGYIPDRLSFSEELKSMPMREFLAKRHANAEAIRARWAEEEETEEVTRPYVGFRVLVGQMDPALHGISETFEEAMTA